MTSAAEIEQQLPPQLASFVRSVRFADGVATLVADASGLGRAAAAELQRALEQAAGAVAGVAEVRVALMADKVQRKIVVVGSGKGGVGKSTLTANLAVALARAGRKVGLVDADIYGPSQPMLLGAANAKPTAEGDRLVPVETESGVKLLSMGQLIAPGKAIAWRGPMTGKALAQLMDAQWGDAEILLVDLPPGTGDVQITILQQFKPAGAIVVSTPQDLALIDATRALDLFRQAQIPVIGLVENMAGYLCPHCGQPSDPFGSGGAEAAARVLGEDFLGRIPLALEIRVASDAGHPPAAGDGPYGEAFARIADRLGAWLKIGRDGVITVAVPQLEMGQGVTTLLPQIVAMELGADWRQVAVEPAPASGAYANLPLAARWAPLWRPWITDLNDEPDDYFLRRWAEAARFSATAEGTSLAAFEQPCREAGAAARAMLAMAAADRWGVAWEECEARAGFIVHDDQRLSFAELAAEASGYSPPDPPPLRPEPPADVASGLEAVDMEIAWPRLDLPSKVDGSYLFAGDVRLPDMVHAAIRHGPLDHAELSSFEREAVAGMPGLIGVVEGKRWLAAVAATWWAAEQALDAMAPRFRLPAPVSSARIDELLDHGVRRGEPQRVALRGDGDASLAGEGAKPDLALRYDVMAAAHGTIETASATARLAEGRLELWIAAQAPERAREAAAEALGMSLSDVVLYPMPAGGSFDRRLEHDHAIEAALIARETGRPVQLTWSRWQEQLALRPRPPVAAVLAASLGPEGRIETLRARLAMPASALEFGRRLFDNLTPWAAIEAVEDTPDPLALEGLMPAYGIPNVAVDHVPARIALPTGRLRGNAHGYTCFMVESFIDEVAQRNAQEPLSFRIAMLGDDVRLAQCLQQAARLGEWGGGAPGTGQGLACHRMGEPAAGGRIALIATAVAGTGGVRVEKLAAAVDIGRVVNRDIALQQIEGGLLYGVGLALGSGMEYERGLPVQGRLAALDLPTLADSPEIAVELIESEAEPFDPGELAVAPVAPAIANALFSATGLRLRRLPLLSGGL